ncbi:MAG: putative primase/helicase, partial [Sphingomonadales bacterium]|nr:putative primase/helicase [Sphingomonadales bacterium]
RNVFLRASAIRLWGAAGAIAGTPAALYLEGRELRAGSPELRFHPRTPEGAKPLTRYRPALIAAVRDERGIVAVHRTFLAAAAEPGIIVARAKCGLGPFRGGAVRLGRAAARLGLAEGIETALSASALFDVPCWATLGTERFGLVAIPACVTELLLFLDNDAGGRRAEKLVRAANPAIASIEAHYPRRAGDDWNDVLMASAKLPGPERGGCG